MIKLKWTEDGLLNQKRFSHKDKKDPVENTIKVPKWILPEGVRTEFERDYDRILFSTPVRRLGDKTQVFPLEKNISIRTRLTHSHEVANLARSIGIFLTNNIYKDKLGTQAPRNIPAILGAIGLAHDIGNPPFGHSGEKAIGAWFDKNKDKVFKDSTGRELLTLVQKNDFLKFEGNAQTIRILTRLQHIGQKHGLKLTYASLAALLKYPEGSHTHVNGKNKFKKFGYFQSEKNLIEEIFQQTGLNESVRHPLTYIMEACDDIAYLVLDAEDAVKKQIASFSDLMAWLKRIPSSEDHNFIIEYSESDYKGYSTKGFSPSELNDVSMQKFRVHAINAFVSAAITTFTDKYDEIMTGEFNGHNLISESPLHSFSEALRSFDKEHAYKHASVLGLETKGFNVINGLMDMLWEGIIDRKNDGDFASHRKCPFSVYAYNRISNNYRRVFEERTKERDIYPDLPSRYYELQLLTDMISGMADNFALDLYRDLKNLHPESPI